MLWGATGFKVSAVSHGNWLTHGSQVGAEQATTCVRAALDAGITAFDTADVGQIVFSPIAQGVLAGKYLPSPR